MSGFRLLTINFWGTEPPLERRLALAARQLAALAPDAIGVQEVRPLDGKAGPTTADWLGERLGMQVVYQVATRWADGDFAGIPGGEEGLAILSRHPIGDSRALELPEARATERRILLSARIDAPAAPVWVHTTHLHYRLTDGIARERQVVAIDDAVRAIGGDAHHLLCGDFNASPDCDEVRFLRGLCTLAGRRTHWQDAWLRVHPYEPGLTWCSENPHTRPLRSLDIDRRIDYVFAGTRRKDGRGTVVDARVVLDEREPDGTCASDHYGVLAEVRITGGGAA